MANAMAQNHYRGPPNRNQPDNLQKKVEGFTKFRLPTFDNSDDPLDADSWLREIENKLDLTECSDEECMALVAHQLSGIASAW